ncbi:dynamin family protein [Pseudonocardia endophytica]|uniref:Dynamin family protein n=1 Tax=Pseudonocardia endophytica TaxID=401976 RepID=A0A4R1IBE4_PSEEN|nr:dynamin family protein [Pseudonocardia endophytica]TCK27752.1 dynamin family protein [Pseudonocardia endophytica]
MTGPSRTLPRHDPAPDLTASVRDLLRRTIDAYADSPQAAGWLRRHEERFAEPLRVAIAGKVKAGKSTLLNALVGEQIAPTDAGECTRIVTWYQDAPSPRVQMFPRQGPPRPLTISRHRGALSFDLQGVPVEQVDRLLVDWPSRSLRSTNLIDTPGIGSLSVDTSARAGAFLVPDDAPSPADAVVYLMRHLHAGDVRFLESFHDRDVARATPVNTIAVLSRADEIGVGRLDALSSARRIARRYRGDEKLRGLCQTVVAVAGLLAETARTMRQDEYQALTELAALSRSDVEAMLLSADRFGRAELDRPDSDTRVALLERFGLFGVRLATTLIRQGVTDPSTLSTELIRRSGLDELRTVLTNQFAERRDLLKSRSALLAVDLVLSREPRRATASLRAEVERILAGAHEFVELRTLTNLRGGAITFPAEAADDAERLLGGDGGSAAARLGLDRGSDAADLRDAARDALHRWKRRAESPLTGRAAADAARVVVRTCEGILAAHR